MEERNTVLTILDKMQEIPRVDFKWKFSLSPKKNCGENRRIKRSDIYVRKGICNPKTIRIDPDETYQEKGKGTEKR